MKIDRNNVSTKVIPAVHTALVELGKALGMHATHGRFTFEPTKGTVSFKVTLLGDTQGDSVASPNQGDSDQGDGTPSDDARVLLARREWMQSARAFGLDPVWLDQVFERGGLNYKIVGLNPKARKFPVMARATRTGNMWKFPVHVVAKAMGTR